MSIRQLLSYTTVTMEETMNIAQIAEAVGLTRRAIRFYVQQRLIDPPVGLGRTSHYTPGHAERLKRVLELQAAGHSLEAIRQILAGAQIVPPANGRTRAQVVTRLYARLHVLDGLELHFDATRFQPDAKTLATLRNFIQQIFSEYPPPTEENK